MCAIQLYRFNLCHVFVLKQREIQAPCELLYSTMFNKIDGIHYTPRLLLKQVFFLCMLPPYVMVFLQWRGPRPGAGFIDIRSLRQPRRSPGGQYLLSVMHSGQNPMWMWCSVLGILNHSHKMVTYKFV